MMQAADAGAAAAALSNQPAGSYDYEQRALVQMGDASNC